MTETSVKRRSSLLVWMAELEHDFTRMLVVAGYDSLVLATPYVRLHQACHFIRTQGLLDVVGRPKLQGLAHVEALGQHQDRQVPVDLDSPLHQGVALEIALP